MTSLHVNRVAPIRATGWFAVAIATTVIAVVAGAAVWSVSTGWAGLATSLVIAVVVGAIADRRSHRNLAAFGLGAFVTLAGLMVAPLVMAEVYVAALR